MLGTACLLLRVGRLAGEAFEDECSSDGEDGEGEEGGGGVAEDKEERLPSGEGLGNP